MKDGIYIYIYHIPRARTEAVTEATLANHINEIMALAIKAVGPVLKLLLVAVSDLWVRYKRHRNSGDCGSTRGPKGKGKMLVSAGS